MIAILLFIVILGVIAYFVDTYVPMSPPFKTLFRIVVVIFIVILLLQMIGVNTGLPRMAP